MKVSSNMPQMCGELLARGHSRSGDPCVLAGYIGNGKRFGEAIMRFADAYADQTEKDWEELKVARKSPAKKSLPAKTRKPAKKRARKTTRAAKATTPAPTR